MGSVGNARSLNLTPITREQGWFYIPRDDSQLYKNPIEYAGNDLTRDVVDSYYGWNHELAKEEVEDVDLRTLKSTQAFVTQQGLQNATGEGLEAWAVRYDDGQLYLMDGNHRLARAMLSGKTHEKILVRTLRRVDKTGGR